MLVSNLETSNETTDSKLVLSPYTITATCNDKTITFKDLRFYSEVSALGLGVDLHEFGYMKMEGYTGTVTYKLQLPTVFADNRETVIEVKWKVEKKTILDQMAEVEEIYINGIKADKPTATLVVDE